ncbi:MAG: hypothetical protein RPR28_07010 [Cycloclasticus sp.]|nr:hypothetical protein A9Q80_00745 [Cycloclasticus sp. 46_83_sub15_T18]
MSFNKIFLATLLCGASFSLSADILLIDVLNKEPVNTATGILRPVNGQSMAQVRTQCGEPDKTYAAVGKPPITRWNYDQFSVYFEHQLVIHSVLNKPAKAP